MATKDRTSLKNDFANGKYATGEKFADLIDSMKVVQLPVVDPQALGTSLSFIDSISQDADGKITATKKTLDLANAHELNPFKGWYKTGDTLPTDGFDGAYLYFKDTSELTGQTTIYRWNGTTYADTGTVVDTSNVQTFASGQQVNTVKIKGENGEEVTGPAGVLSAAAGERLNDKIEGVTTETEEVVTLHGVGYSAETYSTFPSGYSATEGVNAIIILNVQAGDKFLVKGMSGNGYMRIFATGNSNKEILRKGDGNTNYRDGLELVIAEGEDRVCFNLNSFSAETDGVWKIVEEVTQEGLKQRVEALENSSGESLTPSDIVDNLTTNDSQKTLSAKQGKVLNDKIEGVVTETEDAVTLNDTDIYANTYGDTFPTSYSTAPIIGIHSIILTNVNVGDKYLVKGRSGNAYYRLWGTGNSSKEFIRKCPDNGNYREGVEITIEQGEDRILFNLVSFDSITDGVWKIVEEVTQEGLKQRVEALESFNETINETITDVVDSANEIEVVLPDKLYAVVGDTLQIFFQGCLQTNKNTNSFYVRAVSTVGRSYERYFEYTPTTDDIGTTTLTIQVENEKHQFFGSKTCELITVAAPISPSSELSVFTFGDSLTDGGRWVNEVSRRLVGGSASVLDGIAGKGLTNINFYGYKEATFNAHTVNYFGEGGWTWGHYIRQSTGGAFRFFVEGVSLIESGSTYTNNGYTYTVQEVNISGSVGNIRCTTESVSNLPEASGTLAKASGSNSDNSVTFTSYVAENKNPLWDENSNAFTFIPYVENCGASTMDVAIIFLTWNGLGAWSNFSADSETGTIGEAKTFLRKLHTQYSNCKVLLVGLQMPSITGGIGTNNSASSVYSDRMGFTHTAVSYNKCLQDLCNSQEFSFCSFVGLAPQFDTLYNMPHEMKNVNTRNSVDKEMMGTNAVHPNASGLYQVADAVYRKFVADFCQGSYF